jgi:hypothetical protein
MSETALTKPVRNTTFDTVTRALVLGMAAATGGCISISAPDKPIQINLNINVTQEVVYRLDNEAKTLIQQNPGIF